MAALKEQYKQDIAPALMKKFGYKSVMQIPKLDKVVINVGCGEARDNAKIIDAIINDLSAITGQRPVVCKARKSVANFKLREGMNIGAKVTLRGDRMYEFVERLFNVALPRVRDFRGINPNSFDGRGNYNMGLKEQLIFPEIDYDKIDKVRGMDLCFVTTAKTDEEARELLTLMGAPFEKYGGEYDGKNVYEAQAAGCAEVLHPGVQPLQDLWSSPRLSASVWHLPYLLPGAGIQGRDSGREESKLVSNSEKYRRLRSCKFPIQSPIC